MKCYSIFCVVDLVRAWMCVVSWVTLVLMEVSFFLLRLVPTLPSEHFVIINTICCSNYDDDFTRD